MSRLSDEELVTHQEAAQAFAKKGTFGGNVASMTESNLVIVELLSRILERTHL